MLEAKYLSPKVWDETINHVAYFQNRVPYTSQQKGVAVHKNRALKEMATCMLEAKYLSPKIWDEAINFSSYFQNRVPHKSLYEKNPFEAWSGHKPNVSHFRVFCSKAWARIPPETRKELQTQIKEYIMV